MEERDEDATGVAAPTLGGADAASAYVSANTIDSRPRPQLAFPRCRQRGDVLTDLRQSIGLPVSDTVDTLILDLLEWMGPNPRPYSEVLAAWRTSCPRLSVWEDANDEVSSRVIGRRDAARSSRCPPPGRSTCGSTANRRRADG